MIIRSCKLIPVMAAGFFILRKRSVCVHVALLGRRKKEIGLAHMTLGYGRFSLLEYGSALSLIFGTVMFTLADVSVSPSFEPLGTTAYSRPPSPLFALTRGGCGGHIGVFLCSASVMFDALFSNMQEQVLQRYHASLADMVCFAAV